MLRSLFSQSRPRESASQNEGADRSKPYVVDYSAARAKAIEWLGDRYLLARPINRASPRSLQAP